MDNKETEATCNQSADVTKLELGAKNLKGYSTVLVTIIGFLFSCFHLYGVILVPLDPWFLNTIHLSSVAILVFFLYPGVRRHRKLKWIHSSDFIWAVGAIAIVVYIIWNLEELLWRMGVSPIPTDVLFGSVAILIVLEITRRTTGIILPMLALAFIVYALAGNYFPGVLWHKGYSFSRTISFLYSLQGIYGIPIGISATYVFFFVLFGAFLIGSGADKLFFGLSSSLFGWTRGGAGKIPVFSSALFGTISGSAVANVMVDGWLTIPLMKRVGYRTEFAGAVEATASTGGQIMPPVMGAGAFLMADILGIPYYQIAVAGIIPALLYYFGLYVMVDIEAIKLRLVGLPRKELPSIREVLVSGWASALSLATIIYALFFANVSVMRAATYGMIVCFILSWGRKDTRIGLSKFVKAMSDAPRDLLPVACTCACAGIIIGVFSLTGAGTKMSMIILAFSGGNTILTLVLAMIIVTILGMGMPTTAAYIVGSSVIVPALLKIGLEPLNAHLFVFFFGVLSAITPPVALAAYAAASIAKASPMKVGFTAWRLGMTGFLVPFMFAFSPTLLLRGGLSETILAIPTAFIGVAGLAMGLQGWLMTSMTKIPRIVLICGSILLITPGWKTDLIGAALILIVIFLQRVAVKKGTPA